MFLIDFVLVTPEIVFEEVISSLYLDTKTMITLTRRLGIIPVTVIIVLFTD